MFYRTCRDRVGEAKASGNLGNTLKVIGKFDESIVCCMRHLEISRELVDKVRNVLAVPCGGVLAVNFFFCSAQPGWPSWSVRIRVCFYLFRATGHTDIVMGLMTFHLHGYIH